MWLVVIAVIVLLVVIHSFTGNKEMFDQEPPRPPLNDKFLMQKAELSDVNKVLNRPVVSGDEDIEDLQPVLEDQSEGRFRAMKKGKQECLPKDHPIYELIAYRQPYMFTKPEIEHFYGTMNYWDWRYPKKTLDVRFLADPDKYCRKNPGVYPCTVISFRTWENSYSGQKE